MSLQIRRRIRHSETQDETPVLTGKLLCKLCYNAINNEWFTGADCKYQTGGAVCDVHIPTFPEDTPYA